MNWKPGDSALIVVESCYDNAGVNGQTCVLRYYIGNTDYAFRQYRVEDAWSVDVPGLDKECAVAEECLRKPYDGHEPCTWASVQVVTGWVPKELVVVNEQ